MHQIAGGNAFNATMSPEQDPAELSTCTTCQPAADFSNYWTPMLYFRARNNTYKRVKPQGVLFFEESTGGSVLYYHNSPAGESGEGSLTAFRKGFRMRVGNPMVKSLGEEEEPYPGVQHTCLLKNATRFTNNSRTLPETPCPEGVLTTVFFPGCWDGKQLDSADHISHLYYPRDAELGPGWQTYPCPASHPVRIPQIIMETSWNTRPFNDPSIWPEDELQPFVWSHGDNLGYGFHADYLFGWKGNALQEVFDCEKKGGEGCGSLAQLEAGSVARANLCTKEQMVVEELDEWVTSLPGDSMARSGR